MSGLSREKPSAEIRVMFTRNAPRTGPMDHNGERRVTCRYPAATSPIVIGWWVGSKFETAEMALRDISLSGASAVTRTPPPSSGAIWLRLNDPAHPDWVEATVVAVNARRWRWRPALVRMKFLVPCPYDFFKAAMRGIVPPDKTEESIEAGHHSKYWGGQYWD